MMTAMKAGRLTDGEIKRELSDDSTTDERRAELEAEVADRAEKRSSANVWYPGRFA